MRRSMLASIALLLVSAGCGPSLRPAAHYRGQASLAVVSAADIREETVLPHDHEAIGEVSARCTLTEGRRSIRREWLSDIDCSEARLVGALREHASKVGGELLVARECYSRAGKRWHGTRQVHSRCVARVARASNPPLALVRAEPATTTEPEASDAWRIRVSFTPAVDATGFRPARRSDLVRDVANFPVSHVRLGDLMAQCKKGCSPDSVREGVRIAAGRVGATDVVDVRCIARDRGWLCTGTAAAYQTDPDLDPRAR